MRIFMDGTLSEKQGCFLPCELWFATEDCEDNTIVSEDCLCLSGHECESSVDGTKFSCRWKGVSLIYVNDDGEEIDTEDFTYEEFINILKERNMTLQNMSANFDTDVDATITELMVCDADGDHDFDVSDAETIEFIA